MTGNFKEIENGKYEGMMGGLVIVQGYLIGTRFLLDRRKKICGFISY